MRPLAVSALLLVAPAALAGNEGVPDRLVALEARVAELEADRDACEAEVDALAEEVATLEIEVAESRSAVDAAVLDTRGYADLLEEALARIPAHEPDWTNLNERVGALEVQVSDMGGTLLDILGCVEAWLHGEACGESAPDDGADGQAPPEN